LQYTDTIHIFVGTLTGEDTLEGWVDNDVVGTDTCNTPGSNIMKWVIESQIQECLMYLCCFALKVGLCGTKRLIIFFNRNDIHWQDSTIRAGININYNDDL